MRKRNVNLFKTLVIASVSSLVLTGVASLNAEPSEVPPVDDHFLVEELQSNTPEILEYGLLSHELDEKLSDVIVLLHWNVEENVGTVYVLPGAEDQVQSIIDEYDVSPRVVVVHEQSYTLATRDAIMSEALDFVRSFGIGTPMKSEYFYDGHRVVVTLESTNIESDHQALDALIKESESSFLQKVNLELEFLRGEGLVEWFS